jgi:rod shape-determining protein MreD
VISRETLPIILLTSIVALVLSILPLPGWLPVIRPAFLVLVVLYWSTMAPFVAGMALGFFSGLALDVFQGSLLGEHALALSFVTYLALRLNLLTRAKPIFEQSLYVLVALLAYELLLWLIDGWTGHSMSSPLRWVHTVFGALLWPVIVGMLGRFHSAR